MDVEVGKHIFDHCIRGLLNGKTVLMATHLKHFVAKADYVINLDKGRIVGSDLNDERETLPLYDESEVLLMDKTQEENKDERYGDHDENRARAFLIYILVI